MMFERFSDEARRTVVRALAESRLLGQSHVGTEHTLIALTTAHGGASEALAAVGVTLDRVRTAASETVIPGTVPELRDDGPYTARVTAVFDIGRREALEKGHDQLLCGHLLLGILLLGESNAVRLLQHLDVDLDRLRKEVEERLHAAEPLAPRSRPGAVIGAGRHLGIQRGRGRISEPTGRGRACSFCGHKIGDGDRFVAGPLAVICGACVHACAQLLGECLVR